MIIYLYMYDKKGIDLNVEYIRDGEKYKTTIIPEAYHGFGISDGCPD